MKFIYGLIGIVLIVAILWSLAPEILILVGIGTVVFIIVIFVKQDKNRAPKYDFSREAKSIDLKEAVYNRKSPEGYIIDRTYYTKVVGVTFNGVQEILPYLQSGMSLDFVREPRNFHDKNAVAVYCSDHQIGHLSREEAAEIAPIMDRGIPVDGVIEEITGGGKYNYGCNIRVKIYKRKQPKQDKSKQQIKPTVENIDKSNPLYGKTCVLFDYSYPDEEQNIVNLGGILRRSVSSKTDYYIVKNFKNFYDCSTNETNKVRELMDNGGKIQFLSDEEYSKIKEQYLPK